MTGLASKVANAYLAIEPRELSPFGEFVVDVLLRPVNVALRPLGLAVLPSPPSAKMLHETANVAEVHHPSHGGRTTRWLRRSAELLPAVPR